VKIDVLTVEAHDGLKLLCNDFIVEGGRRRSGGFGSPRLYRGLPPSLANAARIKLALSRTVIQHVASIINHSDPEIRHPQLRLTTRIRDHDKMITSTLGRHLELAVRDSCRAHLRHCDDCTARQERFELAVRLHPGECASTSFADCDDQLTASGSTLE
jgi:hypothetical protein